jgi:hypothetical protein
MKVAANELGWVRLNLNPAIWEAIAGTGWRDLHRADEVGARRFQSLNPEHCGQNCADLGRAL